MKRRNMSRSITEMLASVHTHTHTERERERERETHTFLVSDIKS